jgi:sucrose phosphorylase
MSETRDLDLWGEPLFKRTEVRLYRKEPDYHRPLLKVPDDKARVIKEKLALLYGDRVEACYSEIERIMQVHHAHKTPEMIEAESDFRPEDRFTEKDIVAITYPDQLIKPGVAPLAFLGNLLNIFLHGIINTIHILPFYPHSSDRGFSVVDYQQVDARLGSWDDIERLSLSFRLMFDGVINHVSSKSQWFEEFLNGNPEYEEFFTVFDTQHEVTEDHRRLILRPRTNDLLTPFQTIRGTRYVWTTFSPDQIDLNYGNEKVLFRIMDILLYYVRKGADLLRLDAATYLWRELGTSCAHLLETHALVQLIRAVFDVAAPTVSLITETNAPHADNVSYFGDGTDEAHMVYNFSLPPLVLHSLHTGNCEKLTLWASQLEKPSPFCTYFNFLDSHDGIGLLGARDILTDVEIETMVKKAESHGGLVSYRADSHGLISPYELNITWFDAVNSPNGRDPDDVKVNRFWRACLGSTYLALLEASWSSK